MEQKEFSALVEKATDDLTKACRDTPRSFILIANDEKRQTRLSSCATTNDLADMLFSAIVNNPDVNRAAGMAFGELVRRTFSERPGTNDFPATNNNLPN
jgi:hypothetical protein